MNQELTLEELLKSGAHFGHKAARWNPKMAPYIFTTRNKFHIIDLQKTFDAIRAAQEFVKQTAAGGGTVLFVGTKRQAREVIKQQALLCDSPFVITRWLGGTLTNFRTIQKSIRKLSQQEELIRSPEFSRYTKKERLMIEREHKKNTILFEGLRNLKKLPDAIFVTDSNADVITVREARIMKVKILGITDTNADPSMIDFPIPANDDSIKTIELIAKCVAAAVLEGKNLQAQPTVK
ncbi:MAG: 30S ribosomal protein S2 [Candidatus Doudnabacteria bacterium]|nr:30S ribosomal protein S2 [Candidatus Doudnabacteria bacterium]